MDGIKKLLGGLAAPFTTATAGGTAFRDFFIAAGVVIAMFGTLGILSQAQVDYIQHVSEVISGNWPAITTVVGFLMYIGMSIYRSVSFSMSDKAMDVGKKIDAEVAPAAPITIVTPEGQADIEVPGVSVKP